MEFNLKRNLCFFDVEATGLHVIRDRIIQIAIKKFFVDQRPPETYVQLINPGIPISKEAMELTGITPDILRNKPTFQQVAKDIYYFIGDADLAGYNSNRFDIPILMEELARSGFEFSMEGRRSIDVQRIFYRMEPRSLRAAHRFYCNEDMGNSHDALDDVEATVAVLKGQLSKYKDVDLEDDEEFLEAPVRNDMDALHDFTNDPRMLDVTQRLKYNDSGEVVFNFGRYLGRSVTEVFKSDQDYYHWIIKKEFSVQVKAIVKKIYNTIDAGQ
ncbi:MAG: 3'-5' exonuclease [Saprospiraceae bacterium]|nr:3'-5' exonuclease [Saprospiraceae bacterium]